MNQVRTAHGVRPLQTDTRLERAARSHSSTMLHTGIFFHGAFNARIRGVGVRAFRVGENLAWGVGPLSHARAIVRMWMTSPGHRRNLLHSGYRLAGVGALRGSFSGYHSALMITTDFAGK
ncbi:MAG: CAP domain-containing protein [Actinomycetota bacterium]|nr:CAP domain-containing protein [Actinomycetota bacterium]